MLSGKVVVITGASSGIGLATACAFQAAGARVVLAARASAALADAARRCGGSNGDALAVPTDVRSESDVSALARQAVERFNGIDVWVNNAAVTAFGTLDQLPSELFRSVIDTNLFGYYYGMRAVLPVFRARSGGIIINVNSGVAFAPQPRTGAYVVSKHALRALSAVARMELLLAGEDTIHVCDVFPASVDTPLFRRGANYSEHAVEPMAPVHDPDEVARAILSLAYRPRREVTVGVPRRMLLILQAIIPAYAERWIARYVDRRHFSENPARPVAGNVLVSRGQRAKRTDGWQR